MESHFHHIIFSSLLILGFIYGSKAVQNSTVALITPRQRPSLNNDSCVVSTEKHNKPCCVCPGNCSFTYPRDPVKTYSAGITLLSVHFFLQGRILDVGLYLCPRNTKIDAIYQTCLQKNPLRIVLWIQDGSHLKVMVEIPGNLTCHNCLLQWIIMKDNIQTGAVRIVQYYGCSDIAILSHDEFDSRSNSSLEVGSGTGDSQTSTLSTTIGSRRSPFQTSHGNSTPRQSTVLHRSSTKESTTTVSNRSPTKESTTTVLHHSSTKESTTTDVLTTPKQACKAIGLQATVPGMHAWCQTNCMMGYCPKTHCSCTPIAPTTTTKKQLFCKGTGPWSTDTSMHEWCTLNCNRNYCPASHCKCSFSDMLTSTPFSSRASDSTIVSTTASDAKPSTEMPTTPTNTTPRPSDITTKTQIICRPIGLWTKVPGMKNWCVNNCRKNHCPPTHCRC